MARRITCIKKAGGNHENAYTAIESLGWTDDVSNLTGKTSRVDMYDWLKRGGTAYVKDGSGNRADLITAVSSKGTKYVKTVADETKTDNLLQLPEC